MAEPALRVTCQLLVNNLMLLANNMDVVTADHLGRMSHELIRFVANIFNEIVGQAAGPEFIRVIHNIINTGTHIIAIYVDGQGIRADWLTTFLASLNYDWSHDLIRQLAEFRRGSL